MRLLIDVCLTPDWVDYFQKHGIESMHWSDCGACDAKDSVLFEYAQAHGLVIFTLARISRLSQYDCELLHKQFCENPKNL